MSTNKNLHQAKDNKNDEFYTRLEDIEAEISQHEDYVKHFKDKVVLCNCDDPESSNFFVFFKLHFKQLQLKKLITTHFKPDGKSSYKLEWCGEMLNDDMVNLVKTPLEGNGDFRSEECIEILKEADIVVTNPPFSLFRSYVSQLIEYKKKFIIIGNKNAITYKEFFPLLKDNKVWIGYTSPAEFILPDGSMTKQVNGLCRWYTNLDIDKLHEEIPLTKNYKGNESNYPKYDNYDAIECSKVKEIPKDYVPCWFDCKMAESCPYAISKGITDNALCENNNNGEIGVPITYMDKHNSEQFEIIGADFDLAEKVQLENNKIGIGRFYAELTEQNRTEQNRTRSAYTAESLSDARRCNGIIGVPITFLDKFCSTQFEIIGHEHDLFGNGGNGISEGEFRINSIGKYKRILIRKRKCNGVIGVPITFLDKYCFEQFEIIGITKSPLGNHLRSKIYDKQIQHNPTGAIQTVTKANDGAVIVTTFKPSDKPYYEVDNKILLAVYPRILIKKKENVNDSKNI